MDEILLLVGSTNNALAIIHAVSRVSMHCQLINVETRLNNYYCNRARNFKIGRAGGARPRGETTSTIAL